MALPAPANWKDKLLEPMDQEELRRRAQQAMTRKRTPEPESTVPTEESAPSRPVERRVARPAQRPTQRPAQQRRQRLERPRPESTESEEGRISERIERLSTLAEDEARARAERRRAADATAPTVQRHAGYHSAGPPQVSQLRGTLRNKQALRQAILLNEILGKPVALRDQQDSGI